MIDNEIPVLRKEDLIIILEAFFKFSQEPNNAFQRKNDGLYVKDFFQDFEDHINNGDIHITQEQVQVLQDFSINEDDVLCYKGEPIIIKVSDLPDNAIQVKSDGLYIKDTETTLTNHIQDSSLHISTQDRQKWDGILNLAKKYADDIVKALVIYDYQFVPQFPTDESLIKETTVYLIKQKIPDSEEEFYIRYIYREHTWIPLDITLNTYNLFARISDLEANYVNKQDNTVHHHTNKDILDKFSIANNRLLFNNLDILDVMQISDDNDNALMRGSDDKLFVKDLSSELKSIAQQASLSKVILLNQDCKDPGIYELEEEITDFNFIMIHYYLMPDDENLVPYDAKMEMLDTDSLIELYDKHIDYIIEHDYGVSTYNTKFRFIDTDKMQITYYNHVCIYKIIGVR